MKIKQGMEVLSQDCGFKSALNSAMIRTEYWFLVDDLEFLAHLMPPMQLSFRALPQIHRHCHIDG
jgi:hypothetical protein